MYDEESVGISVGMGWHERGNTNTKGCSIAKTVFLLLKFLNLRVIKIGDKDGSLSLIEKPTLSSQTRWATKNEKQNSHIEIIS